MLPHPNQASHEIVIEAYAPIQLLLFVPSVYLNEPVLHVVTITGSTPCPYSISRMGYSLGIPLSGNGWKLPLSLREREQQELDN